MFAVRSKVKKEKTIPEIKWERNDMKETSFTSKVDSPTTSFFLPENVSRHSV